MTLQAADELRHLDQVNKDYFWRESLYFNFNDARNEIGGWLYLWVVPNQPQPSGMLVSFYHGDWPAMDVNEVAAASPSYRLMDGGKWVYCFQKNADYLLSADFDDVELFGLRFRRQVPLKRQQLTFDDGEGNGFDLTAEFLSPPYDYADGAFQTPSWMAANRYHRAWRVEGSLCIAGTEYGVHCTGDSDHSWGQRHNLEFAKHLFKMWSFQTIDGHLSISVLYQGIDEEDHQVALGFVMMDGVQASAATVRTRAHYDANGVQHDITLEVTDMLGRTVRARMPRMHSYIGHGSHDRFWGFEGVGDFIVDGVGTVPGLSSYFWPARVKPSELHAGKYA